MKVLNLVLERPGGGLKEGERLLETLISFQATKTSLSSLSNEFGACKIYFSLHRGARCDVHSFREFRAIGGGRSTVNIPHL